MAVENVVSQTPAPRATRPAAVPMRPAPPAMAADSYPSRRRGSRVIDQQSIFTSFQTLLQGLTRGAAKLGTLIGANYRGVQVAANVLEGQGKAIATNAGRYAGSGAQILQGGAKVLVFLGKVAPVLNLMVATNDTYKAAVEKDPARQDAAWANAGLSIASTALGIGGLLLAATPAGWLLGLGAAAIAAFQLWDTFGTAGNATAWLGNKLVKPLRG